MLKDSTNNENIENFSQQWKLVGEQFVSEPINIKDFIKAQSSFAADLKKITYHLNVNMENNKNKIIDHLNFSLISKLKNFFTFYNPSLPLGNESIPIKQKLNLIQTNLDTFNRSIAICLKALLINRYLYKEIDEFFKSLNLMNGAQSELEIALMIESFFVHLEKKFNFIKS